MSLSTDYISVDPYSGKKIGKISMWTESRIDKCLDAAAAGYAAWSACSLDDRLQGLQLLKNALTICLEDLSRLISLEIGKPITQSRAEVNKSISLIDY